MNRKPTWLLATVLLAVAPLAQAQQRSLPNSFYIFPQFTTSQSYSFEGGTTANTDTGTGFGFGYERTLNKNFAAGGEYGWSSSSYRATVQPGPGNASGPLSVNGHVSSSTFRFFGTYYILDNPLTPYLTAGLGWTHINSDIPSGIPQGVCWWSPWYGQVCGSYQPTRNTTKFSYSLGLGVRQDFAKTMFVRGSANAQWVQIGDTGTTQWVVWRVDLGWRF